MELRNMPMVTFASMVRIYGQQNGKTVDAVYAMRVQEAK